MKNSFQEIDANETAPKRLKNEVLSEVNSLRNTMELVSLFIGRIIQTVGTAVSNPPSTGFSDNAQDKKDY